MSIVAERLNGVKVSPSLTARGRVETLRAEGRNIVDFTVGEPDFPTPAHIVAAGIDALRTGQTRYTSTSGTPALRRAIAAKLQRENGMHFAPEQVVVAGGAKQVIFEALAASLNVGDEVIVPAPYWVSYPDIVAIHGGVPVAVGTGPTQGFKLTPAALEAAITARTRWLILNSPNNPTGAVYTAQELRSLADVLARHPRVWVLTDEIYEHFVFGGAKHVSILAAAPELAPRTLIVNGMSKAYAMTGWRLGYGAGPLPLIRAITMLLSQNTSCAASISQHAGVVALEGPQECVADAVAEFERRCTHMTARINAVPGMTCDVPDGAFYLFPSVQGLIGRRDSNGKLLANEVDVVMFLLEEAGVATMDGGSYGMAGFLRVSFATSLEQIDLGCERLRAACARLH